VILAIGDAASARRRLELIIQSVLQIGGVEE